MKAVDIHLDHPRHVSRLVNITNRYPFTITLRKGRYVVDGKSVLGVYSLHRSGPVTMEIYSDDCQSLLDELQPLMHPSAPPY